MVNKFESWSQRGGVGVGGNLITIYLSFSFLKDPKSASEKFSTNALLNKITHYLLAPLFRAVL